MTLQDGLAYDARGLLMSIRTRLTTMMALVLLFLGAATSQIVEHLAKTVSAAPLPDFRTMAREYGKVFRKAAENITPAVVNIVVFKKVENEAGVLEDELGLPFNFHHR